MPSNKKTLEEKLARYFSKQLRRFFYRSPLRREFITKDAKCSSCKVGLNKEEIDVDHKDPVVPVNRPVTSYEYFLRMFCYIDGVVDTTRLEVLCKPCHKRKSKAEMGLRAHHGTGPYSQASKDKRKATAERNRKKRRYGKK